MYYGGKYPVLHHQLVHVLLLLLAHGQSASRLIGQSIVGILATVDLGIGHPWSRSA